MLHLLWTLLPQLDALGRPANLAARRKAPPASRAEAAREIAALKHARRECENATAAYNELIERLEEASAGGREVNTCLPACLRHLVAYVASAWRTCNYGTGSNLAHEDCHVTRF